MLFHLLTRPDRSYQAHHGLGKLLRRPVRSGIKGSKRLIER